MRPRSWAKHAAVLRMGLPKIYMPFVLRIDAHGHDLAGTAGKAISSASLTWPIPMIRYPSDQNTTHPRAARMRRRKYAPPPADQPLDEKLQRIAEAFEANLARVAKLATEGTGTAQKYAADHTERMPKKHVIASTFALCEETLHSTLGELWWRCSMSESKPKGNSTPVRMVKTILAAIEDKLLESYDEWPPIEEFMHDFSASSHTIPQITGKHADYVWDSQPFQLMFAAESEMENGNPQVRANAITRDMVKLCIVECPIKAVVYRGYDTRPVNDGKRQAIIDRIVDTIRRCPPPGTGSRAWLFIGLFGRWPDKTEPYFHTMAVGADAAQPRTW